MAAAVKVSIVFSPHLSTKRQKEAPRNSASERYFRKKAHHAWQQFYEMTGGLSNQHKNLRLHVFSSQQELRLFNDISLA